MSDQSEDRTMTGAIERAKSELIDLQCVCHVNEGETGREALKRVRDYATVRIAALAAVEAAKPAPELEPSDSLVQLALLCADALDDGRTTQGNIDTAAECLRGLAAQAKPAPEAVEPLRAALAELVACKDLKDEAEQYAASWDTTGCIGRHMPFYEESMRDYLRRQPLAWEAARRALSHSAPETAPVEAGALTDEKDAEIERLKIRGEAYENAYRIAYQATYQSHSGHWDPTMQHGAGCRECIRAREARENCDAAIREGLEKLAARAALRGSASETVLPDAPPREL